MSTRCSSDEDSAGRYGWSGRPSASIVGWATSKLLGYGGAGHDGAYLTDSMMVVIVDPHQKTLSLLSLPRDSWVPLSAEAQPG